MLSLNITIDISERLEAAINSFSAAVRDSAIRLAPTPIDTLIEDKAKRLNETVGFKCEPCDAVELAVGCDEAAPECAPVADASNDVPGDKKKHVKKKTAKKAETAPVAQPDTVAVNTTDEPENVKIDPPAVNSGPEKKEADDPMAGMTVVEAMNALVNEIQSRGIDMADVNSRVRAKAGELGLTYSSAACLIKAIGYVETRKVAIGEK